MTAPKMITRLAIICDTCDEAFGLSIEPTNEFALPTIMIECLNISNGRHYISLSLENPTNYIAKAGVNAPLTAGELV